MSFLGLTPFRTALAIEIFANFTSLPGIFLDTDKTLSYLVQGPSQITPATRALTQVFGAFVAALTVPLVLAWPNPQPGSAGDAQIATRRTAYLTVGAGELCISAVTISQYIVGNSGMTDNALLISTAVMVAIVSMRGFFLYLRPDLLAVKSNGSKKTQ